MRIRWKRVTWYSKLLAVVIFIALPFGGIYLGYRFGEALATLRISTYLAARQGVFLPNLSESEDQFLEAKTRLAISENWDITPSKIFRDVLRPNRFYFSPSQANPQGDSAIMAYDIARDRRFKEHEENDVSVSGLATSYLLRQSLAPDRWFRLLGTRGSSLIFREAPKNEQVPRCTSEWLYQDLESIDVLSSSAVRQPYVPPDKILKKAAQDIWDCQDRISP